MHDHYTGPYFEEILRRTREAICRRDWDAVLAAYSPDASWDASAQGLAQLDGHEALRVMLEDYGRAFEELDVVPDEFRDLGNGVTLQVATPRGRPFGSTALVDYRIATVVTWANGLIRRVTSYSDIDEACAAAERLGQERV
jgi:ketosteroid isomerase-like protein